MKISIALEEQLEEIEVHIRAARISEELRQIERALAEIAHGTSKLVFYKKKRNITCRLQTSCFLKQMPKRCMRIPLKIFMKPSIACMNWKRCSLLILCGYQNRRS